jgi:hypothetical protein
MCETGFAVTAKPPLSHAFVCAAYCISWSRIAVDNNRSPADRGNVTSGHDGHGAAHARASGSAVASTVGSSSRTLTWCAFVSLNPHGPRGPSALLHDNDRLGAQSR